MFLWISIVLPKMYSVDIWRGNETYWIVTFRLVRLSNAFQTENGFSSNGRRYEHNFNDDCKKTNSYVFSINKFWQFSSTTWLLCNFFINIICVSQIQIIILLHFWLSTNFFNSFTGKHFIGNSFSTVVQKELQQIHCCLIECTLYVQVHTPT